MSLPCLQIDPGATGAAVLLAPNARTVRACWTWTHRKPTTKRGSRYDFTACATGWPEPMTVQLTHMGQIPPLLTAHLSTLGIGPGGFLLGVEAVFVKPGTGTRSMTLGETAGILYGPIAPLAANDLADYRPRAREDWRPVAVGLTPAILKGMRQAMGAGLGVPLKSVKEAQIAKAHELRIAPLRFEGVPLRTIDAVEAAFQAAWTLAMWTQRQGVRA